VAILVVELLTAFIFGT